MISTISLASPGVLATVAIPGYTGGTPSISRSVPTIRGPTTRPDSTSSRHACTKSRYDPTSRTPVTPWATVSGKVTSGQPGGTPPRRCVCMSHSPGIRNLPVASTTHPLSLAGSGRRRHLNDALPGNSHHLVGYQSPTDHVHDRHVIESDVVGSCRSRVKRERQSECSCEISYPINFHGLRAPDLSVSDHFAGVHDHLNVGHTPQVKSSHVQSSPDRKLPQPSGEVLARLGTYCPQASKDYGRTSAIWV